MSCTEQSTYRHRQVLPSCHLTGCSGLTEGEIIPLRSPTTGLLVFLPQPRDLVCPPRDFRLRRQSERYGYPGHM